MRLAVYAWLPPVDKWTTLKGLDLAVVGMSETQTTTGGAWTVFWCIKVNQEMTGASLGFFNWNRSKTTGLNAGAVNILLDVKARTWASWSTLKATPWLMLVQLTFLKYPTWFRVEAFQQNNEDRRRTDWFDQLCWQCSFFRASRLWTLLSRIVVSLSTPYWWVVF